MCVLEASCSTFIPPPHPHWAKIINYIKGSRCGNKAEMETYGKDQKPFRLRLLPFAVFSLSFMSFSSPLPPFLCRLEFISNQRASRELQLLITFSFAFLHINDCRVFGGVFCRSGLKAPQSRVLPGGGGEGGGGETGQRRGSEPVQSPWTEPPEGGRWLGGIWDGWILAVGGTTGVHRLKVNVPYQHKNKHMSSVLPNYCHIEQFTHLI